MSDSYGSSFRELMKRSMEKPAGEWRPLNRRRRSTDRYGWAAAIVGFITLLLILVIVGSQIAIWKGWLR